MSHRRFTGCELSRTEQLCTGDGTSGSLIWRLYGQALNERNVDLIPDANHSVSARVSNFSFPRRDFLQVQVGCNLLSPLQEQTQLDGSTWLRSTNKESLVGHDANLS